MEFGPAKTEEIDPSFFLCNEDPICFITENGVIYIYGEEFSYIFKVPTPKVGKGRSPEILCTLREEILGFEWVSGITMSDDETCLYVLCEVTIDEITNAVIDNKVALYKVSLDDGNVTNISHDSLQTLVGHTVSSFQPETHDILSCKIDFGDEETEDLYLISSNTGELLGSVEGPLEDYALLTGNQQLAWVTRDSDDHNFVECWTFENKYAGITLQLGKKKDILLISPISPDEIIVLWTDKDDDDENKNRIYCEVVAIDGDQPILSKVPGDFGFVRGSHHDFEASKPFLNISRRLEQLMRPNDVPSVLKTSLSMDKRIKQAIPSIEDPYYPADRITSSQSGEVSLYLERRDEGKVFVVVALSLYSALDLTQASLKGMDLKSYYASAMHDIETVVFSAE